MKPGAFREPSLVLPFFLILVYLVFFVFCVLYTSSNPESPSPGRPDAPVSRQEFQGALDRIAKLEDAKSGTYSSEFEKTSADLATIGTYIAIALTLAALIVALISFNKFQDSIRKDAREQAWEVVNYLHDYLKGRYDLTTGYVLGQLCWDKEKQYAPFAPPHVAKEAIKYLEYAYEGLGKPSESEFKGRMAEYRFHALNNLLFYITKSNDQTRKNDVVDYARKLRESPGFRASAVRINTYCGAVMKFLDLFIEAEKKPAPSILSDVEDLCNLQASNKQNDLDREELAGIKADLDTARKNPRYQ